jgi:hypothetical protein
VRQTKNWESAHTSNESQILLYRGDDGKTQIQVKLHDETVWLTQAQMAELFQ